MTKIDTLLITHYHGDHIGGLEGLLARMPVGTVIDHGDNRETSGHTPEAYQRYLQRIAGHKHIVAKAGDVFHVGALTVTIVMADAQAIARPLPGAGADNAACAGMQPMAANGGEENARSTASVISYGKVRIAAFGDLTWDREKDLFCPVDKVGKVDVYLASHHSIQFSGSPAMVDALAPIVAIAGNGPRKGDTPERIRTILASPRIQGLWRLHESAVNPEIWRPRHVANLGTAQDRAYNPAPAHHARRRHHRDQRAQRLQQDLYGQVTRQRRVIPGEHRAFLRGAREGIQP